VMFADAEVDEYQVVLTSDARNADIGAIRVMPKNPLAEEVAGRWQRSLAERLNKRIGITFIVEVLAPGALVRSEYKAKRWMDQRGHAQRS